MYPLIPRRSTAWDGAYKDAHGCIYIGTGTYRIGHARLRTLYSNLQEGHTVARLCGSPPCISWEHLRGVPPPQAVTHTTDRDALLADIMEDIRRHLRGQGS
jgi:hypothetical protein